MPAFFLAAVPEFEPVWTHCQSRDNVKVTQSDVGYVLIESEGDLVLERKVINIKPAVWFGLFTAGLEAQIAQYDLDTIHLKPATARVS